MDTDRNLLFGVLALQADLIDADRFTKACALWVMDKDRLLADILVERQWLAPSDRADVEKLVQRKLAKHGEGVLRLVLQKLERLVSAGHWPASSMPTSGDRWTA